MSYDQICAGVKHVLARIGALLPLLQSMEQGARIAELQRDMEAGFYSIVVLGEFNRGKSTLLNAILGEELLPTDILPTTATIHVLRYSREPLLRVHWRDGRAEDRTLSPASMRQFTSNSADVEAVSYLEIGTPSSFLSNGVVYIDTPGVGDLNKQRAEITYQFVPRSDAVLFLLDANTPVRRSEAEFLECSVLASGVERLIFIANFADMIEPEEHDSLITTIRNRLATILGKKHFPVLVISAQQGIEAKLNGDQSQWKASGIPRLLTVLRQLQIEGPGSLSKARQFVRRAAAVLAQVSSEFDQLEALQDSSSSVLSQRLTALVKLGDTDQIRRSKITVWVEDRERDILAIIGKSLDTFGQQLCEDIRESVTGYIGSQFQQLVQERIPGTVKRKTKDWVESHTTSINQLLSQLHQELALGLEREFHKQLLSPTYQCGAIYDYKASVSLEISAKDISKSHIQAGLVVGVAASALMLTGATVLLPLAGMAALPLVQQAFLERKLNDAKAQALPEIGRALRDVTEAFAASIVGVVRTEIRTIREAAERAYDENVASLRRQTEAEILRRQAEQRDVNDQKVQVTDSREVVQGLIEELREILESTSQEVAVV